MIKVKAVINKNTTVPNCEFCHLKAQKQNTTYILHAK